MPGPVSGYVLHGSPAGRERDVVLGGVVRSAGRIAGGVTPRVTMLVVGMRGWPLMDSGHVTRKLAEAERLRAAGHKIRILSEIQFRQTLGLETTPDAGGKSLTAPQSEHT